MRHAHIVVEMSLNPSGALEVVRAGIYGEDHQGLTRNLKLVGATVLSMSAPTYEEAVKKCLEYAEVMRDVHAYGKLYDMLKASQ